MLPEPKPDSALRSGPEKCVFIYNANHNRFRDNWFERCGIGVHFTAGSEGNEMPATPSSATQPGEIRWHPTPRLVDRRPRQLLERQSSVRPQRRRNRRYGVPAERSRRSRAVDRAVGEGPHQQPCRPGDPLGAGAVSGPIPGGVVDSHPLIAPPPKPSAEERADDVTSREGVEKTMAGSEPSATLRSIWPRRWRRSSATMARARPR